MSLYYSTKCLFFRGFLNFFFFILFHVFAEDYQRLVHLDDLNQTLFTFIENLPFFQELLSFSS
jgi:hypothetical protein